MNLIKFQFVCFFCILSSILYSQEIKYPVSEIPKELLENSKAVVRYDLNEFEVYSSNSAVIRVKYVITILNNNAIENSKFIKNYNKFSKIKNIKAIIYDAQGYKVKKISNSDIRDFSAISDYSIYDDNRVKYIDPKFGNLPFTIEYSYEVKLSGFISYPSYIPLQDYNIALEKSEFRVITPKNLPFRYLIKNMTNEPVKKEKENIFIYEWRIQNLLAIKEEMYTTEITNFIPIVYTAPLYFKMNGYEGNYQSWKSFGEWIMKLNYGKNNLSKKTQHHIKNLLNGTTDKVEKIKILYNYLQNKTRYVSIQVGIGGLQPFDAEIVDKYSYGDCKALSNYMKSLLDVANIKSYYSLVPAGRNIPSFLKDFPSNQFNHAIICIPMEKDTIWLECTSQLSPFGYLGTFTDDRDALLITENGGELVHTPVYSVFDNKQVRKVVVSLNSDLSAMVNVKTSYKGLFYDKIQEIIHIDDIDKKRFVTKNIDIANFELLNFSHKENKNIIPQIDEEINFALPEYGIKMNNIILLPLNLMNKIDNVPLNTTQRKFDIQIQRSNMMVDSVVYIIPDNYLIDKLPGNQIIKSIYGDYNSRILINNQQITYIRTFTLNKGIYPATDYLNFTNFFEKIQKIDQINCVLKSR